MKIKNQLQKQQEKEFQENLSFAEWLDHFRSELTSKELDDMERESFKITPINNKYYQPLKGA
ncbi:MAG: hypothetical protein LHW46_00980 [Candidatus Cloacimonetes bacterium]|nr:hypothetical protein [Candidatus Cloacimonadota bacterium]